MATEFDEGFLVGILVGEGHFGGDGRQPQVTLRMHERHIEMFLWLERTFPGGRLYGPYDHGGRRYYQWMARGAFLCDELMPLLERRLVPTLDGYAHVRLSDMIDRYRRQLSMRTDYQKTLEIDRPAPGPSG
jgi:hypothetical protein